MNMACHQKTLAVLTALLPVFAAALSGADRDVHAWDNLNRLRAGQKIQVVNMDLKGVQGRFAGFDEGGITIRTSRGDVTVPRAGTFRVGSLGESKRKRNLLIGAGTGLVAGVAIGGAVRAHGDPETAGIVPVLGVACAGIGAAVGAAMPGHPTIYRAAKVTAPAPSTPGRRDGKADIE